MAITNLVPKSLGMTTECDWLSVATTWSLCLRVFTDAQAGLVKKSAEYRGRRGMRHREDRKSTRLNSSHTRLSRMPSSA